MLTRAVHRDRRLLLSAPDACRSSRLVERVVRRRLERGLVETGGRQDPAYALDVEVLTRVARAGQREQVTVEVETGAQHAERLHWLVARAWVDRARDVADRPVDRAVGGQRDARTRGGAPPRSRSGRCRRGSRKQPRGSSVPIPAAAPRPGRRRSGTIARVSAPDETTPPLTTEPSTPRGSASPVDAHAARARRPRPAGARVLRAPSRRVRGADRPRGPGDADRPVDDCRGRHRGGAARPDRPGGRPVGPADRHAAPGGRTRRAASDCVGPVERQAHNEFGPFRRLHIGPATLHESRPADTWFAVPVHRPLLDSDLDAIARAAKDLGRTPLLLACVGVGMPTGVSGPALVRATLAAAELLGDGAEVVAVSVADHGWGCRPRPRSPPTAALAACVPRTPTRPCASAARGRAAATRRDRGYRRADRPPRERAGRRGVLHRSVRIGQVDAGPRARRPDPRARAPHGHLARRRRRPPAPLRRPRPSPGRTGRPTSGGSAGSRPRSPGTAASPICSPIAPFESTRTRCARWSRTRAAASCSSTSRRLSRSASGGTARASTRRRGAARSRSSPASRRRTRSPRTRTPDRHDRSRSANVSTRCSGLPARGAPWLTGTVERRRRYRPFDPTETTDGATRMSTALQPCLDRLLRNLVHPR